MFGFLLLDDGAGTTYTVPEGNEIGLREFIDAGGRLVRSPNGNLGRSSKAQIQIPFARTSRNHGEFTLDEGKLRVALNPNNTNPTCLNGELVSENFEVQVGDIVQFGAGLVRFVRVVHALDGPVTLSPGDLELPIIEMTDEEAASSENPDNSAG